MKTVYLLLFLSLLHTSLFAQQCWQTVSAGIAHTVAIRPDGTLWAWGFNGSGQLGDGTTAEKKIPIQIGTDANWKFVSAGGNHTLAVKTDGTLWGWGDNLWGQVGDGTFGAIRKSPVKIGTASDWEWVSTGRSFSLAIKNDGSLWGWGENFYGQLGHGAIASAPRQVGTATDWRSVSAGGNHTVALKTNNTLWAWGLNLDGQLGDGTTDDKTSPTQVGNDTDWLSVVAGFDHTIAIRSDGSLWTWGNNDHGQLGDGTLIGKLVPAQIESSSWKSISAANANSLAIKGDGTLWAWGFIIGSGLVFGEDQNRTIPTQLTNDSNWKSITSGDYHSFAFQTDWTLWGWGDNSWGKLGDDSWSDQSTPQLLSVSIPVGEAVQNVCNAGTLADLKVTGSNIKWYASPSEGTPLSITTPLVDATRYYASATKHQCESESRLAVLVSINTTATLPPTGLSTQHFCGTATVGDLTATGSNVKWYSASSGGSPLEDSHPLADGVHYYATQTLASCESTSRHEVAVTVNTTPAPDGDQTQTVCMGSTLADLEITGTAVKWYVSETDMSPLSLSTLVFDGADYFATQTFGLVESCTRFHVHTTVVETLPPVGDANQEVCMAGIVSDLKASGTNILWYDSPVGGNVVNGDDIVNGQHYYASQYENSCWSTSRLEVTAMINSTPHPVDQGDQFFCTGATIADLKVTGNSIRWYDAETEGQILSSNAILISGAAYFATQTIEQRESCYRLRVVPTIRSDAAPSGPALQEFCNEGTVGNLITSSGYPIKWYGSISGDDLLQSSDALVDGAHYYASQTIVGCESSNRFDVTVIINKNPTPAPTGSYEQETCGTTIGLLTVNGINIKWYASAIDNTALPLYTPLQNGTHYYATQTISGCESFSRFEVVVTLKATPPVPTPVIDTDWKTISSNFFSNQNIGIKKDGTLWGWGDNSNGQLGNGTSGSIYNFATPLNTESWKSIEVGRTHTVGIKYDGTLWAWGNEYGNLFEQPAGTNITVPVKLGIDDDWSSISAGGYHTLALKTDGSLWAWGYNEFGQLGDETNSDKTMPVQVGSAKNWKFISAGLYHSFGIKTDGSLWGWGANEGGELGNVTGGNTNIPIQIGTSRNWKTVSAGTYTCFAIQTDGTMWVWGFFTDDAYGELQSVFKPTQFGTEKNWQSVSTGPSHALAIKTDGTLWALWGNNFVGELGIEPIVHDKRIVEPKQIGTSSDWQSVETGLFHSLALKNDGSLWACGLNETGELGVQPEYDYPSVWDQYISTLRPIYSPILVGSCGLPTLVDLKASGSDIQWYSNASGGAPLPMSTLLEDGGRFYATQSIEGCESTSRLRVISMTLDMPAPTGASTGALSGTDIQYFCSEGTVENLNASGSSIKWYDAPSGGSELLSSAPLIEGARYYAAQVVNGCESQVRLEVVVSLGPPQRPDGYDSQHVCFGAIVQDLMATGANLKWYDSSVGGSPLELSTVLKDGARYYASQTINGCESQSRLEVTVAVGTAGPTGNSSQSFCDGATIADLSITGSAITWYNAANGGASLPLLTELVNGSYYASQTINGCESQSRLEVTVSVGTSIPTGNSDQAFCYGSTIGDLSVTGTDVRWYNIAIGGSMLSLSTKLVNGYPYYASQTIDGCESRSRLKITASVGTASPTGDSTQTFCYGATIGELEATGNEIKWYDIAEGGSPLSPTTKLLNGAQYYASQTVNGCESRIRMNVLTKSTDPPTGIPEQSFCTQAALSELIVTGTEVKWYAAIMDGVELPSNTILTDGYSYFASQTINGCESVERLRIVAWVKEAPDPPLGESPQILDEGMTISDLVVAGTDIKWYHTAEDAEAGMDAIAPTAVLVTGTTYFATQTTSGCESAALAVIVTTVTGTELEGEHLKFYPNPVNDILMIAHIQTIENVTIINTVGQKVISKKVHDSAVQIVQIDLSALKGGVYFVEIVLKNAVILRKVTKL